MDRLEHRTFKLNFTGDGADKLRDSVKDKLKEFMGDYTDDTLVVMHMYKFLFLYWDFDALHVVEF